MPSIGPFCAAKCPYCDFTSYVRTQVDEEAWVSGVERELDWVAGSSRTTVPSSKPFFGGGTPSLMSGRCRGPCAAECSRLWLHARSGTPPAIPPEAVHNAPQDHRSDLYQSALAYWMLTNQHAYPANCIDDLPEVWQTTPPAPLRVRARHSTRARPARARCSAKIRWHASASAAE